MTIFADFNKKRMMFGDIVLKFDDRDISGERLKTGYASQLVSLCCQHFYNH